MLNKGQNVLVSDPRNWFWTKWVHEVVEGTEETLVTKHAVKYAEDPEGLVFTFRKVEGGWEYIPGENKKLRKNTPDGLVCQVVEYSGPVGKGTKVVIRGTEQAAAPETLAAPVAEETVTGKPRKRIRDFFETEDQQRRALDAFFKAWSGEWSISEQLLDYYDISQAAFGPSSGSDEAFRTFEKIYNELAGRNWQVFRSPKPNARRWPAEQVFVTIRSEFAEFSWHGKTNLLNFLHSGTASQLESRLTKMQGIKEKTGYPHMTVSKFLHFYNPALFPIYDNKIIWGQVFKRFDRDFREFCRDAEIPYDKAINDDTARFLIYYMGWASSLLSVAHGRFMQVFAEWLGNQPGATLPQRRFDPTTLLATAFEMTAVGAAGTP